MVGIGSSDCGDPELSLEIIIGTALYRLFRETNVGLVRKEGKSATRDYTTGISFETFLLVIVFSQYGAWYPSMPRCQICRHCVVYCCTKKLKKEQAGECKQSAHSRAQALPLQSKNPLPTSALLTLHRPQLKHIHQNHPSCKRSLSTSLPNTHFPFSCSKKTHTKAHQQ